eukprot:1070530_1
MEPKHGPEKSLWYINGVPQGSIQITIYSKIIENMRNEIRIESPWKIFPKHHHCGGSWRFNRYLVSNNLGLVRCRCDANRRRFEIRNNCVHSIDIGHNNTQYSFKVAPELKTPEQSGDTQLLVSLRQ